MSLLVKIGVAGVIGFAATTGASAHTLAVAMDQPGGLLAISETPLDMSELSEARGGFKFGGFDFKFGVQVSPVVIAPMNLFPDSVFSTNGGANGAPVAGDDGVFGEEGVFGPNGVFGQNGPSPTSGDDSFAQENNPVMTSSGPVTSELAALTPAPTVLQIVADALESDAPAQQAVQSSVTYSPTVVNTAEPTVAEVHPIANASPLRTVIIPSVVPTAASTVSPEGQIATAAAPSAASAGNQQSVQSSVVNGFTTVVNNTMNNVQFRRVVNIDVVVSNFDARITRAIGDSVTSSIASTYGLLSRF